MSLEWQLSHFRFNLFYYFFKAKKLKEKGALLELGRVFHVGTRVDLWEHQNWT